MVGLKLVKATPENGLMNTVISDWDKQLSSQRLPKGALDSLRSYEANLKPDKTYGVFILCDTDKHGKAKAPFEAFVHINHAHPKSPKPTLRLVWSGLAPRYEWEDGVAENHARIYSDIITNAITLSLGLFSSHEIKLYLFNSADRKWGHEFADSIRRTEALTSKRLPLDVRIRGSWLHLTHR